MQQAHASQAAQQQSKGDAAAAEERRLTGYNIFVSVTHAKLKQQQPEKELGEHMKTTIEMWRSMSAAEKATWRADGEQGSQLAASKLLSKASKPARPLHPSSYQQFVKVGGEGAREGEREGRREEWREGDLGLRCAQRVLQKPPRPPCLPCLPCPTPRPFPPLARAAPPLLTLIGVVKLCIKFSSLANDDHVPIMLLEPRAPYLLSPPPLPSSPPLSPTSSQTLPTQNH